MHGRPFTEPVLCRECVLLNAFHGSSCLGSFPNSVRCDFDLQELLTDLIIPESIAPLAASLALGSPSSSSLVSPGSACVTRGPADPCPCSAGAATRPDPAWRGCMQPEQAGVWASNPCSNQEHSVAMGLCKGNGGKLSLCPSSSSVPGWLVQGPRGTLRRFGVALLEASPWGMRMPCSVLREGGSGGAGLAVQTS